MSLADVESIDYLSPIQEALLLECVNNWNHLSACGQLTGKLYGEIDVSVFEWAWRKVAGRHAAFRTSFMSHNVERPLQIAHKHADLTVEHEDWQGLSSAEQEARVCQAVFKPNKEEFIPSKPYPHRLMLYRTSPDAYRLIWIYHRLLLDSDSA